MDKAFQNCTSLERVIIPSSVKSIGKYAFSGCVNLMHIDLSSVKTIGIGAFMNCTKLRDVELCEGLENIMDSTFLGCESFERITVPSSVKMIRSNAFSGCTNLIDVDLVQGLECIEFMAFADCGSLEDICIPISVKNIGDAAFMACSELVIEFSTGVGDGVVEMARYYDEYPGAYEAWHRQISFLVEHKIPKQLGEIPTRWGYVIHDMINHFHIIKLEMVDSYCSLILERLRECKELKEAAVLLELVIWKSRMVEQNSDLNSCSAMRSKARHDCGATVIIPHVLSFLVPVYDIEDDLSQFERENGMYTSAGDDFDKDYIRYLQWKKENTIMMIGNIYGRQMKIRGSRHDWDTNN
jgi:hypothetical protein